MRSFFTNTWCRGLLVSVLSLAMASAVRADEVTDWHEHLLAALGKAGVNPLVSSRDAALVSAAVFDAVNGIQRRYAPIHVPAAAPRGSSKRAAAVQAAYVILLARFPAQADDLNAKREASLAPLGKGKSVRRGVEWGQTVAEAILVWRSTDGFTPAPPLYLGGLEPGRWRPTPPGFAAGAGPQFATMTPWGILSPDQFRPLGPPALDSEQYLLEFNETKAMGSATSALRTADQTDACLFWNSGSATYLWNRAAIDLGAAQGTNLSENARLLATLNLAIADGLIACWDAKYEFEFWRPVTAIRLADDPGWTPLLATPNHPEYTSGHSSASSAAATVLADYFGDETPFMVQSPAAPGWVRFYPSFSAAVDEVTEARVFAGIHFRAACEDGAVLGSDVAGYILENSMDRIHGEGKDERDDDDHDGQDHHHSRDGR
jgi:PAP2 superfamily